MLVREIERVEEEYRLSDDEDEDEVIYEWEEVIIDPSGHKKSADKEKKPSDQAKKPVR